VIEDYLPDIAGSPVFAARLSPWFLERAHVDRGDIYLCILDASIRCTLDASIRSAVPCELRLGPTKRDDYEADQGHDGSSGGDDVGPRG
jgi:hypothetical protein